MWTSHRIASALEQIKSSSMTYQMACSSHQGSRTMISYEFTTKETSRWCHTLMKNQRLSAATIFDLKSSQARATATISVSVTIYLSSRSHMDATGAFKTRLSWELCEWTTNSTICRPVTLISMSLCSLMQVTCTLLSRTRPFSWSLGVNRPSSPIRRKCHPSQPWIQSTGRLGRCTTSVRTWRQMIKHSPISSTMSQWIRMRSEVMWSRLVSWLPSSLFLASLPSRCTRSRTRSARLTCRMRRSSFAIRNFLTNENNKPDHD